MPSSARPPHPRPDAPFPTRRSSDLLGLQALGARQPPRLRVRGVALHARARRRRAVFARAAGLERAARRRGRRRVRVAPAPGRPIGARSEEHTSELQSRFDLVCRLLLDLPTPAPTLLSLHDALPIFSDFKHLVHDNHLAYGFAAWLFTRALGVDGPSLPALQVLSGLLGAAGAAVFASLLRRAGRSERDRKSTRLNSSHVSISYAVFCSTSPPPPRRSFPYTTLFRSSRTSSTWCTTTTSPTGSRRGSSRARSASTGRLCPRCRS